MFGLLLGLLGIVIDGVDALLGLECSPITIVGLGSGNACSANVVCCENNSIVSVYMVASPLSVSLTFSSSCRAASSLSAASLSSFKAVVYIHSFAYKADKGAVFPLTRSLHRFS